MLLSASARARPRLRALHAVTRLLPRGRTMSADWARRHRWMVLLVCANAAGLFAFALVQGAGPRHALFEASAVGVFAVLGVLGRHDRRVAATAVAFGLLTASAVTVHLSNGAIEAHFHFFVMIAVLTLYEDWLPFLAAFAFVLLHHGVVGLVDPESVFNHADAIANPLKWALIHAGFVAAAGAANVLAWRLHEETRGHLRQLATIVESSQDAILSVSSDGALRSWNGGACRVFGWEEQEVLHSPFGLLLQPGRAAEDSAVFDRVLGGEHVDDHESEWLDSEGRSIPISLSASPLAKGATSIGASPSRSRHHRRRRPAGEQLRQERQAARYPRRADRPDGQLGVGCRH